MVKGITETISMPSLINLDYADVHTILTTGGVAIVGIGESSESKIDRVEEAINDALSSPLLELDISGAKGALIHVTGGQDMTLQEANKVSQIIGNKMASKEKEVVNVVGRLCTPLDLLADKMELPKAEVNDLVVILQSGAYGLTASPTTFLSHPEPKEILV